MVKVSAELLATTGRPVDLFGFEPNPARLGAAAAASASVPGIALTQLGALLDAADLVTDHVDDDGLHIDERLAGHTGLLTGRPLRLPAD